MKKTLYFLLINICTSVFGQIDTIKTFYENGNLKQACFFDSTHTGLCKYYYSSGELNVVNYLVNNELNGKQTSFYKTGVIQSLEYFTDGSLNDSAFYYHDNATIYRKGKYINDFYEGEWKSYYENGALKQIGRYISGNPHGVWFFYTDCAKLETQIEYVDGKKYGQYLVYHPKTQKVIERRKYENDIEIGVRIYYKKNGKQIRP